MIISPDECATHPHRTGRVPHPSGDVIPGMPALIRISPLTLADTAAVDRDLGRPAAGRSPVWSGGGWRHGSSGGGKARKSARLP
jgi:hypothetical protein